MKANVQRVKHNETGNIYMVLAHATTTTKAATGESVIVYCPDDEENTIYVKEQKEFYETFTEVGLWGGADG